MKFGKNIDHLCSAVNVESISTNICTKKVLLAIFCSLALMIFFIPVPVNADIGPKLSVVISFKGLEGETYYATLLSKTESTGPYSVLKDGESKESNYADNNEDYNVYLKFLDYKDDDGFYFLQFIKNCTDTQKFSWIYYPPREFKILLYFPETDTFVASRESYECYAFDSYFTVDASKLEISNVTEADSITATRSYDCTNEIFSLIIRIIITIFIEILIALLFRLRNRKQIGVICVTNVITQTVLNILLNIINYKHGFFAFIFNYIWMELVVFIIEGFVYQTMLARYEKSSRRKAHYWLYALAANAVSFAAGMLIAIYISAIF